MIILRITIDYSRLIIAQFCFKSSPRVPGHEIIGKVAAVGSGVSGWTVGDRVGGGWHGGHDGRFILSGGN